jgi:hypothetical protein
MYHDKLALILEFGDDAWILITIFEEIVNPGSNPRYLRCVPPNFRFK